MAGDPDRDKWAAFGIVDDADAEAFRKGVEQAHQERSECLERGAREVARTLERRDGD